MREARSLGELPELLRGSQRVLILCGPSRRHVEQIRGLLAGLKVAVFDGARRHVPAAVVAEAAALLRSSGADAIVTVGGGAAIGLGKALRLDHAVRFVAVPTTYSGSERTELYGITSGRDKRTGRDPRVRPDAVVYDVELTLDMPRALTVTSLMNALAHPVGTLGAGAHDHAALEAAQALFGALEALVAAPSSRRARLEALRGAALAAGSLGGDLGRHHHLAHRLGGRFDVEHGALHAVLLPHTVHALRDTSPIAALAERLGVPDLEGALFDLLVRAGAATSLGRLGVPAEGLRALCAEAPELPRDLLWAAFHGRRPSAGTRTEDWGLREPVSVRGPALERARRVVLAVHGRGDTADGILRRAVELTGDDPTIAIVAPQAPGGSWYGGRYDEPRASLGEVLAVALDEVTRALDRALAAAGAERVALFGFSQGACLALEVLGRSPRRPATVVALSGARIGAPDERWAPAPELAGTRLLLGVSAGDPWIVPGEVERLGEALAAAGCDVRTIPVPGDAHALHGRHRIAARELLTGAAPRGDLGGFGNAHETEALPGALPVDRNSPRRCRYGLYAEQLSGTGFTTPRRDNLRSWLYRIRPAAQQGPLAPLAHPGLAGDFTALAPEPNLCGWSPRPLPEAPQDFVDGLETLCGAGSATARRGFALHTFALDRGMEDRCLCDADGDLLLLPELGALTILTELGVLEVAPGQLALVPRGLRFSVLPAGPAARGYLAETFGRHFRLPERGPVGANGLADARHFRAPQAWHEDRLAPGYRVTVKAGGQLYEATQDWSPYDVVAWHGTYAPYVYDLSRFSPVGNTRFDHGDPSIYTVLSSPLDEPGTHALDLVVFAPRWDPTEGTFRPPYFHRNAIAEINGILRDGEPPGSPFAAGACFITPAMAPHGVLATSVERALAAPDETADRPHRIGEGSLWFQLESSLPLCLAPRAKDSSIRIPDWPHVWGAYRTHFSAR